VYPTYVSTAKVEQNTEHRPAESPSTGLTKDDAERDGQPQVNDPTGSWTWQGWNYNRVPPAIEEAVYEKFKQGSSKSKLARDFRLNRRTIIRICRSCGKTQHE
jgi:DNA invertase Pin-like site-specific DNA recombinase